MAGSSGVGACLASGAVVAAVSVACRFRDFGGWRDAFTVRGIRNAVRASMTNDVGHVGVLAQVRWWRRYRRVWARREAFGRVAIDHRGQVVGYGLARWDAHG